jgi:hypothetical protein
LRTYASYLHRIEAHFRPITESVVNNTDYIDWESFQHTLAAQVRHRNGPDRHRRIAERERKLTMAAGPMEFRCNVRRRPTSSRPLARRPPRGRAQCRS